MKKNIKKAFIIILAVVIICSVFTACSGSKAESDNTTTSTTEKVSTISATEETSTDVAVIEMGELINAESKGRQVVKISCDDGIELSYDVSEKETSEVEVTLSEDIKDKYFYVTMAGNVTAHTLISDGSLFDGLAKIENGKAQFSITYDNDRTIDFIINVPNAA